MILATTPNMIREDVLAALADKTIAETFYNVTNGGVDAELIIVFFDGYRVVLTLRSELDSAVLQRTNGKGGWI
jgi:hypothetical protein